MRKSDAFQEAMSTTNVSLHDILSLSLHQFLHDITWELLLESQRPTFQTYLLLVNDTQYIQQTISKGTSIDVMSPIFNWIILCAEKEKEVLEATVPFIPRLSNVVLIQSTLSCVSYSDAEAALFPECMRHDNQLTFTEEPEIVCSFSGTVALISDLIRRRNETECSCDLDISSALKVEMEQHTGVQVWSSDEMGTSSISPVGVWNFRPEQDLPPPTQFIKPFKGLRGKVFNITTNKIFQVIQPDGSFKGLAFDILNELMLKLNFTYVIHRPPDGQWGTQDANGQWTGMIGQIVRKPIWRGSTAMLLASTPETAYFAYLNPFDSNVLICMVAAVWVVSFMLWILARSHPWEKYVRDKVSRGHCNISEASFGEILLRMFGALFTQDIPWKCHTMSVRVIMGSLLLCNLIIGATYTGNLVALLTVTTSSAPVDSLYDLVHATEYKAGLVKGQALVQVLKESNPDSLYHSLWEKIASDLDGNLVENLEEGFNRVLNDKFIFMDDTKNLRSIVSETDHEDRCNLNIGREKFFYTYYAFPLQMHSPYLELFNDRMQTMIESGLVDYWRAKYGGTTGPKDCHRESTILSASSVGLNHLSGNFLLLPAGLGTSFVFLLLEIAWKKLSGRQTALKLLNSVNPLYLLNNAVHLTNSVIENTGFSCIKIEGVLLIDSEDVF
ncbi:hypothetical protein CAPTEDRAFT_219746 [Capitella teleta]|uniref:Ionotropic glutamate receptor L-glutamate and glycine-binding domain-containing protein n=1 Tax=Capitella teleta TaxID=283909 RepID=R7UUH7_CAPTE|nr:hypothetical protein CAPTEDRAFT_219746 [Capitella teleta]|eukprot:ELU07547.1 hypothetical protein CAPTEDRAFT_219746 [Capitella teleta]